MTRRRRRTAQRRWRPAETRGGTWVRHAIERDIRASRLQVGMLGRLIDRKRRRKASVAPRGDPHPFVTGARTEDARESLAHSRPSAAIVLAGKVGGIKSHAGQEIGVEMRFDRADRDVLAVRRLIAAVEGRAAVDDVIRPLVRPDALLAESLEGGHEMRDAIDHCNVDGLASPSLARVDQGRQHSHRQVERATAKIRDQVERRGRWAVGIAKAVQRARQRQIVDVVSRLPAPAAPPGPIRSCEHRRDGDLRRDRHRG